MGEPAAGTSPARRVRAGALAMKTMLPDRRRKRLPRRKVFPAHLLDDGGLSELSTKYSTTYPQEIEIYAIFWVARRRIQSECLLATRGSRTTRRRSQPPSGGRFRGEPASGPVSPKGRSASGPVDPVIGQPPGRSICGRECLRARLSADRTALGRRGRPGGSVFGRIGSGMRGRRVGVSKGFRGSRAEGPDRSGGLRVIPAGTGMPSGRSVDRAGASPDDLVRGRWAFGPVVRRIGGPPGLLIRRAGTSSDGPGRDRNAFGRIGRGGVRLYPSGYCAETPRLST